MPAPPGSAATVGFVQYLYEVGEEGGVMVPIEDIALLFPCAVTVPPFIVRPPLQ